MTSRDTEIERLTDLITAAIDDGLYFEDKRRALAEEIFDTLRSQPASEPSLDVERLARAIFYSGLAPTYVASLPADYPIPADLTNAVRIAEEYARLPRSQPADKEAGE